MTRESGSGPPQPQPNQPPIVGTKLDSPTPGNEFLRPHRTPSKDRHRDRTFAYRQRLRTRRQRGTRMPGRTGSRRETDVRPDGSATPARELEVDGSYEPRPLGH